MDMVIQCVSFTLFCAERVTDCLMVVQSVLSDLQEGSKMAEEFVPGDIGMIT